jgi:hypothetical protein
MTVTVSDFYVVGCTDCCSEIERITRAAIRDFSVTKLSFTPGHRHNHETETKQKQVAASRPSASAVELEGQQVLPGTNSAGTNGFDSAVL